VSTDIRREALLGAKTENVERLAQFMGIQLRAPDPNDPNDRREYKFALCDQIARRTDKRYFKR
jgi:hypothetical protein